MSVTDLDVSALVHLAYRIREDTHGLKPWDRQGTHVIFTRELKGKHLLTAIEIVVGHAADPNAKTPAAITRPFLPAAPTSEKARPPKRTEQCRRCGGWKGNCACMQEHRADDESEEPPMPNPSNLTGAAMVRAALSEREA